MQRSISAGGAALAGLAALVLAPPSSTSAALVFTDAATTSATQAVAVVVNEFAPSGWLWHSTDEFVELRNTTDHTVVLDGWKLVACLSPSASQVAAVFDSTDVIPPGGYLLLAHIDYADANGGPPDGRYGVDVPEDGGWLPHDPWSGNTDGVGLQKSLDCTEGNPAPQCDWAAGEAVTRDAQGTDLDDNAADFTCQLRTPGS